ncbi:tetratricopeptide repeat protein 38-like [Babylonia areolata]|uniref:tetratricopeptide repeat protein 38-like n=1 Tax=Babylonia areolata TaxID=304850 RepID=UPI003FD34EBA
MMGTPHCNWRTVEEWGRLNVPLSTTSNEASKMYDAALTQLMAKRDDPSVGGLSSTIKTMLEADTDFVVGQCLSLGLQMFSGSVTPDTDLDFRHSLDHLTHSVQTQPQLTSAERSHVKAVELLSKGHMKEACVTWEDVLVGHPHDVLALHMAYLGYIYLGDSLQLRDSVARVMSSWSSHTPLYGYLLGMHAFGLEETSLYDRAEKEATKALEMNERDAWATHSLSHVFEMTGQQSRGIHFLDSTVNSWNDCNMLACHNWWHLALHHVELGNFEEAADIFQKQVKTRCLKQREAFNLTDAASLLFRLEMQGVKTDGLWTDLREVCQPYLNKHVAAFNDVHLLMTCLGAGDDSAVQCMTESMERFISEGKGTTHDVHQQVGQHLYTALTAYKEGDFAKAVNVLYPVRYQVFSIGGSHAQRDVFNQFLIVSALQSSDKQHHSLARALLAERKSLKDNSPLTDRLLARVKSLDVE